MIIEPMIKDNPKLIFLRIRIMIIIKETSTPMRLSMIYPKMHQLIVVKCFVKLLVFIRNIFFLFIALGFF